MEGAKPPPPPKLWIVNCKGVWDVPHDQYAPFTKRACLILKNQARSRHICGSGITDPRYPLRNR